MEFPNPIQKGVLLKRYKRFFADIDCGGETITAHCANTGSMMGVKEPGSTVWYSAATNPDRKLKFDWQVIEIGGACVCINTASANKIVGEALDGGKIADLSDYDTVRPEVKYGQNSRIDFLLSGADLPDCYVEVKNVTLSRQGGLAEFPDARTARGTKHLGELADMVRGGHRAVMLYLVNRTDCEAFKIAADIDPDYMEAFQSAQNAGVEFLAISTDITETGIQLGKPLAVSI